MLTRGNKFFWLVRNTRGNKFFWLVRNTWSQEVTIYDCDAIPDSPLMIIHSQNMVIDFLDTQIHLVSEHEKSNAKLAAMNFYQDQYALRIIICHTNSIWIESY